MFDFELPDFGQGFAGTSAFDSYGTAAFGDINFDAVDSFDFDAISSPPSIGFDVDWSFTAPANVFEGVSATDWNFNDWATQNPSSDSLTVIESPPVTITGPNTSTSYWDTARSVAGTVSGAVGSARQFLDAVGSFTRDAVATRNIVEDTRRRLNAAPANINNAVRGSNQVQRRPTSTGPAPAWAGSPTSLLLIAALGIGAFAVLRK